MTGQIPEVSAVLRNLQGNSGSAQMGSLGEAVTDGGVTMSSVTSWSRTFSMRIDVSLSVSDIEEFVWTFLTLPLSPTVDVYEVPTQATTTASEPDGAADKRLADEFRRQYMDDMARRRQQRKKKPVQAPKPRSENVLRGPKLGGSRNSRAAVRNMLLEQKKNAK